MTARGQMRRARVWETAPTLRTSTDGDSRTHLICRIYTWSTIAYCRTQTGVDMNTEDAHI